MSQSLRADALSEVTRSVLGSVAFLFCDDLPERVPASHGRLAEAVIRFVAPVSGALTLRMPWDTALEAAANLLGVEKHDPDAQQSALLAVAELLNMISGAVLKEWFGGGTTWSLGVPTTREVHGLLPSPSSAGARVQFLVDEACIEVEVQKTGAGDDQGPGR